MENGTNVQADVPAMIAELVEESSIVALLEDYCRFLLKHQKVQSLEECKTKVGEIISLAMDRGDATQATLAHFDNWFKGRTISTAVVGCHKRVNKFLNHALVEEMGEILAEKGLVDSQEPAIVELMSVYKLFTAYKDAAATLGAKYGTLAKSVAVQFVAEYSNAFDEEFVARINEAKECCPN